MSRQQQGPSFDLTGKIALVTGGTAGLGRETVLVLAAAGATVIFTGRNVAGAEQTLAELEDVNAAAAFLPQDTTVDADWQRVMDRVVDDYGRLDILINNAGAARLKPIADLSVDDVEFLLAVNVTGMYLGIRHAFHHMDTHSGGRGSIVNISALNALRGSPNSTAYALAKGGTTQLARAAAIEGRLGARRIRVNAVHPGVLFRDGDKPSPGAVALYGQAGAEAFVRSNIATVPLGRLGHPRDIGTAVAFLASDAACHITGAEICVDGGRSAGEFGTHHGVRSQR
ncbi:MAG: SDR family NAD(P)-dependent oxidoreductase [Steroidobacteraceae bacterium]